MLVLKLTLLLQMHGEIDVEFGQKRAEHGFKMATNCKMLRKNSFNMLIYANKCLYEKKTIYYHEENGERSSRVSQFYNHFHRKIKLMLSS